MEGNAQARVSLSGTPGNWPVVGHLRPVHVDMTAQL